MNDYSLPRGYDAWRTSPPEARRSRWAPDTVKAPLCIEDRDVQFDAWGIYDAETGALVTVEFNGDDLSAAAMAKILALIPGDFGSWDADMDGFELERLCREAAADAEADYGDYLHDLQRDLAD